MSEHNYKPYEKVSPLPRLWIDSTRIYAGIPSYTTKIDDVLPQHQSDYVEVVEASLLHEANEQLEKLEPFKSKDLTPEQNMGLPVPRIQMETIVLNNAGWLCELSLVKKHFLGHITKVIIGVTKIGGIWNAQTDKFYIPFRDGAHMKFDMYHLKLPCYLVNGTEYKEYQLKKDEVPGGMFNEWEQHERDHNN